MKKSNIQVTECYTEEKEGERKQSCPFCSVHFVSIWKDITYCTLLKKHLPPGFPANAIPPDCPLKFSAYYVSLEDVNNPTR